MMNRIWRRVSLAAMAALVAAPLTAQPTERERERDRARELQERLRELRAEIRDIERELFSQRSGSAFGFRTSDAFPRVFSYTPGRVQLGVFVRTRADEQTDEVGAVLESVTPGGPADEAGLMAGDIITRFNGVDLTGPYDRAGPDEAAPAVRLIDMVREMDEGDEVEIQYERDGQRQTTTVTLREVDGASVFGLGTQGPWIVDPEDARVRVRSAPDLRIVSPNIRVGPGQNVFVSLLGSTWLDIEMVSLNPELGRYFGTDEGILVIRAPDEDGLDLQAGDVIVAIDGREPTSPSGALRILRSYEPGETMEIRILRDRNGRTITWTVPEREEWREREMSWLNPDQGGGLVWR